MAGTDFLLHNHVFRKDANDNKYHLLGVYDIPVHVLSD